MYKAILNLSVLAVSIFSLAISIANADEKNDHRLVSRYEGSEIISKEEQEYGDYKLITGRPSDGKFESEALKGKLTRIVYRNPKNRSTLEIFSNYQQAMTEAGFNSIYTCALESCGPAYVRSAWGRFNGLFTAADGDPRYFSGKLSTEDGTAYVALMVGKNRTQLDIVEIKAMQENMVVADAGALAQGIDREGKVSVYGIYFDTDKADIKPESKPALDEIAKLLRERESLKIFVVGHTDMTGSLEHNRTLSEARARSVVKSLINNYQIAGTRLDGYGVGPLAPVATNNTEAGKAKNRRVELVAR